jgi:phage-related minor tail protein
VTLSVWVALGVAIVATLGAGAFAAVRGLEAWRTFRRFRRKAIATVEAMNRHLDELEQRLADAGQSAARLERARGELQESLDSAAVLMNAVGEVRAAVGRITAFVPSK